MGDPLMPNQDVHLKRWQAVGVLVALTLSYVVATALVTREGDIRAEQVQAEAQERSRLLAAHTRRVDERLCQGTVENRMAVRATWNAARTYILRTATPESTIITNEFFDRVLDTIPELECAGATPIPAD